MGSFRPAFSTAAVIEDTEEWVVWTSHELPPLKSMPRLKPRTLSEPSPTRITTKEATNQIFLRPTKSTVVRPW